MVGRQSWVAPVACGVLALALSACGNGTGSRFTGSGGASGAGGAGGASVAPPLLAGPCDWRGVGDGKDVRFSPDDKQLVVSSGTFLKVFDAVTGAHRHASRWQLAGPGVVGFSRDGAWMGVIPARNITTAGASMWRTDDPQQGQVLLPDRSIATFAFSPDSTLVALLASDRTPAVLVFRMSDLSMVASLPLDTGLSWTTAFLDFSRDGSLLVLRGYSAIAWSTSNWSTSANVPMLPGDPELPRTDRTDGFSADGSRSAFFSPSFNDIGVGSGNRGFTTPSPAAVTAIAVSHDGNLVAAGDETGHVYVWQITQAFLDQQSTDVPLLWTSTSQTASVGALSFSHNDATLASAAADGTLFVWRVKDGMPAWHAEGIPPDTGIKLLAADARSNILLTTGGPGAIALDASADKIAGKATVATGAVLLGPCVASHDGHAIACPEDDRIAYATLDGTSAVVGASLAGMTGTRAGVALSPDHTRLVEDVTAGGLASLLGPSEVRAWPLPSGTSHSSLAHVDATIVALVFSADGSRLAGVASTGAPLRLWDAASGAPIGSWGPAPPGTVLGTYQAAAITDDGSMVAAVDGGTPTLLLATVGGASREIRLGDGQTGHDALAFSPDGAWLAASTSSYSTPQGSSPTTLGGILVRTSDGAPTYSLPGASRGVAFLSNGTLARDEDDGTISLWCLP